MQVLAPLRLMTYRHYALASGIGYKTAAKDIPPLVCRELVQLSQVYNTQDIGFGKIVTPTVICALTQKGERYCRKQGYLEEGEAAFCPNWTTGRRLYKEDNVRVKTLNTKDIFHTLGIVNCQAAIRRSLALNPSRSLVRMMPDFKMIGVGKTRKKLTADRLPDGSRIEPDSITIISNNLTASTSTLFLEYQHRNRSTAVFKKKLETYLKYFNFAGRKFDDGTPLLLFVVSARERVQSMVRIEQAWRDVGEFRNAVRIAWEGDITDDFLRACWVDGSGSSLPILVDQENVH